MNRQAQSARRVVVSTVVRGASFDEPSGFYHVVEVEQGAVIGSVPVPEARHLAEDPNPRGGLRGGRGVSSQDDLLVLASNDTLRVVGPDWAIRQRISHPLAGGIHDVHAEGDGVWVSATAGSLVLKLSWDGELLSGWHWAEDRALVRALGLSPRAVPALDLHRDYRVPSPGSGAHDVVHLNAVCPDGDRLLVGLGQVLSSAALRRERLQGLAARAGDRLPLARGGVAAVRRLRQRRWGRQSGPAAPRKQGTHAIVALPLRGGRVQPGRAELLWHAGGATTPKHNLLPDEDGGLWFTDSERGLLVKADIRRGDRTVEIGIPGGPPFARGLQRISATRMLVGSQRPAAIHSVNLASGAVERSIDLGGAPSETVYALTAVPPRFEADPLALDRIAETGGAIPAASR